MSEDAKYCVKKQEFVTRRIAGETIIVPLRSGVGDWNSIYTLNQPGTMIWQLLGAGSGIREIADCLCREYEVSIEEAAKDAKEFLDSLRAADLICSASEDGG